MVSLVSIWFLHTAQDTSASFSYVSELLLNSCWKVLGTDEKENGTEKERTKAAIGR